jgi:uncharacterized protein (UPF0276 family)
VIGLGLTLQPEDAFLELLGEVCRADVDYYEVAPETLWWEDGGRLLPNGYHRRLRALLEETGKPVVGHGVGLSLCGTDHRDGARRRRWLRRLAVDHAALGFRWYTDHLGVSAPAGQAATLPLPVWQTPFAASVLRRRLLALQRVVPLVGVENSVFYFTLGDPLDEPAFLMRALGGPGLCLLLDLHNVHTMAQNLGFDAEAYLARLDLSRVIEIHLSGGTYSDGNWLPSGRSLRLDSHDGAVPEEVWRLLGVVLPKCTGLRGVTLERMEGTVGLDDVPLLREELRRARRLLGGQA